MFERKNKRNLRNFLVTKHFSKTLLHTAKCYIPMRGMEKSVVRAKLFHLSHPFASSLNWIWVRGLNNCSKFSLETSALGRLVKGNLLSTIREEAL